MSPHRDARKPRAIRRQSVRTIAQRPERRCDLEIDPPRVAADLRDHAAIDHRLVSLSGAHRTDARQRDPSADHRRPARHQLRTDAAVRDRRGLRAELPEREIAVRRGVAVVLPDLAHDPHQIARRQVRRPGQCDRRRDPLVRRLVKAHVIAARGRHREDARVE